MSDESLLPWALAPMLIALYPVWVVLYSKSARRRRDAFLLLEVLHGGPQRD